MKSIALFFTSFLMCLFLLPSLVFSQDAGLNMEQTVTYINEKIKKFSDKPENIRTIRVSPKGVNPKGEIEERQENTLLVSYYAEDIELVSIAHYSNQVYRVRLECFAKTSSCIRSGDPKDLVTRPHAGFFILTEMEALRLQKAFEHLITMMIKQEKKYDEPFDPAVKEAQEKGKQPEAKQPEAPKEYPKE